MNPGPAVGSSRNNRDRDHVTRSHPYRNDRVRRHVHGHDSYGSEHLAFDHGSVQNSGHSSQYSTPIAAQVYMAPGAYNTISLTNTPAATPSLSTVAQLLMPTIANPISTPSAIQIPAATISVLPIAPLAPLVPEGLPYDVPLTLDKIRAW